MIPVGTNRVVTVYARDSNNNTLAYTIRAVTDIIAGNNSVTVNWSTTAYADVLYSLHSAGINISSLTSDDANTIKAAIDSNTHASLIDSEAIATDFTNNSLKDAQTYIINGYTIYLDLESTYLNYTAFISDPVSDKIINLVPGLNSIQHIEPVHGH